MSTRHGTGDRCPTCGITRSDFASIRNQVTGLRALIDEREREESDFAKALIAVMAAVFERYPESTDTVETALLTVPRIAKKFAAMRGCG